MECPVPIDISGIRQQNEIYFNFVSFFAKNLRNFFLIYCLSPQKWYFAEEINRLGIAPLMDSLRDIGEFPLLDSNWDPRRFSWEHTAGRIHGTQGLRFLIDCYITPHVENSSRWEGKLGDDVPLVFSLFHFRYVLEVIGANFPFWKFFDKRKSLILVWPA